MCATTLPRHTHYDPNVAHTSIHLYPLTTQKQGYQIVQKMTSLELLNNRQRFICRPAVLDRRDCPQTRKLLQYIRRHTEGILHISRRTQRVLFLRRRRFVSFTYTACHGYPWAPFPPKKQVSWTCHEHVGAWSRSGSLVAATEHGGEDPTGLASAATASSAVYAAPAAATADACAVVVDRQSLVTKHPTNGRDSERETALFESSRATAGPVADEDESERVSSRSSSGQHGKGVGVLARIKGRFGRHAG